MKQKGCHGNRSGAPRGTPRLLRRIDLHQAPRLLLLRPLEASRGEARGMGSKGPGHPPLLHPPPSIWVQEQQKLRLVQIAGAPYSVLSGEWHGDSRGAEDREGRSTGAMKPFQPLRSQPPQWCGNQRPAALPPPPPNPAGRGLGGRICLPASHKPYVSKFLARGAGLLVHPSARTALNHCVPWGVLLRLGGKEKSPGIFVTKLFPLLALNPGSQEHLKARLGKR